MLMMRVDICRGYGGIPAHRCGYICQIWAGGTMKLKYSCTAYLDRCEALSAHDWDP